MKTKKVSLLVCCCLTISICLVGLMPCADARPTITKDKIPADMAEEIKVEVIKLYAKDPIQRANAAIALREYRPAALKPVIPFLVSMFHDDAPLKLSVQYNPFGGIPTSPGEEAAKTLGKIGSPAVKLLLPELKNKNAQIRKCATVALGGAKDAEATEPLLALIGSEPKTDVVAKAIWAVGEINDKRATGTLITLLDETGEVRDSAVEALCKSNDPCAVGALIELLRKAERNSSLESDVKSALHRITGKWAQMPVYETWWQENKAKCQ